MNLQLNYIKSKFKFINSNKFTIFFIFCLIPFSLNFQGIGISINYIFCLILIYFFLFKKIFVPSANLQFIMLFYLSLFLFHIFLDYSDFLKKFLSFIFFFSIFSFSFLKISDNIIKNFKLSILFFVIIYFVIKILTLSFLTTEYGLNFDDETFVFSLNLNKHSFGSKYEGIVYLFAFWIIFFSSFKCRFGKLLKVFFLLFTFYAIYLTFAKASVLTLFLSFFIYLVDEIKKNSFHSLIVFNKKKLFFLFIFLVFILSLFLNNTYFLSFKELINFILNFNLDYIDHNDSAGFRIQILLEILKVPTINLLLGSGYLGINFITESYFGSAHNQYVDIFLRTGIFGLFFYLLILYRLLIFLKYYDISLYYGFLSILIYGFFIETFRLSQISFILSFLLGIYDQNNRKKIK